MHKDTLTVCVYCPCCGEIRFQKLACKCRGQIVEFFAALPRPHVVAIEAVGFYRWLWDLLEPIVEKLVLTDATAARALAGRRLKTDREDAQHIAELLAVGRLPVAYAPPVEVQILKDQTRHRNQLSRLHARVLHQVKSLMNANNRPGPARLQSHGLIRYFKAFESKLPTRHAAILWKCVDQLTLIERQMAQAEIELTGTCSTANAFAIRPRFCKPSPAWGRSSAPRCWPRWETSAASPIAKPSPAMPDCTRGVFASGGRQREGHIAKTGPRDLRWVLQQAAWTAIRCEPAELKRCGSS